MTISALKYAVDTHNYAEASRLALSLHEELERLESPEEDLQEVDPADPTSQALANKILCLRQVCTEALDEAALQRDDKMLHILSFPKHPIMSDEKVTILKRQMERALNKAKDNKDLTRLHRAILSGTDKELKSAIDEAAKNKHLDIQTSDGNNYLHFAAMAGRELAWNLLSPSQQLDEGKANRNGASPIDYLIASGTWARICRQEAASNDPISTTKIDRVVTASSALWLVSAFALGPASTPAVVLAGVTNAAAIAGFVQKRVLSKKMGTLLGLLPLVSQAVPQANAYISLATGAVKVYGNMAILAKCYDRSVSRPWDSFKRGALQILNAPAAAVMAAVSK
jgi:hypothetical protein